MKIESQNDLQYWINRFNIKNYLHVGAYNGEEGEFYSIFQPDIVTWVEPTPHMFEYLKKNTKKFTNIKKQNYFDFVISDNIGEIDFNLIGNSESTQPEGVNLGCSSILELKEHSNMYPWVKKINTIKKQTITLDKLYGNYDLPYPEFLNMDVQGAELKVLKGGTSLLNNIKMILAETAEVELYDGGVLEKDLTEFLKEFGFFKYRYYHHDTNWGDTLYIKEL